MQPQHPKVWRRKTARLRGSALQAPAAVTGPRLHLHRACLLGTVHPDTSHTTTECPPRSGDRRGQRAVPAAPTSAGAVPGPGGAAHAAGVSTADTFLSFLLFFSATWLSFLFCFAISRPTNCKDTGNESSHQQRAGVMGETRTSSARMGNMLSFSQSPTPSLHHLWTAYRGCISRLFGVFYLTQLPSLHEHRLLRVKKGTCPVVEMPCFHCGGTGSIPGRGTKSPQAMQCRSRPSKEEKKYPF